MKSLYNTLRTEIHTKIRSWLIENSQGLITAEKMQTIMDEVVGITDELIGKTSVKFAKYHFTTNQTLSGLVDGNTAGSVTLKENEIVLLSGQNNKAENGLYEIKANSDPVRPRNFDTVEKRNGTMIVVNNMQSGQDDRFYQCLQVGSEIILTPFWQTIPIEQARYRGVAAPSDAAPSGLVNGDWVRCTANGTYTNFDGISANAQDILAYNSTSGSWAKSPAGALSNITLSSDLDANGYNITNSGQLEAAAIAELRLHDPSLNFAGFADTSTATPAYNDGDAWKATEAGTIFGIANVPKGAWIVSSDTAFSYRTIGKSQKSVGNAVAINADISGAIFKESYSLLNKYKDNLSGGFWNKTNGSIELSPGYSAVTNKLKVIPGLQLRYTGKLNGNNALVGFDADGNYVSSLLSDTTDSIFTIPEGVYYIGIGTNDDNFDNWNLIIQNTIADTHQIDLGYKAQNYNTYEHYPDQKTKELINKIGASLANKKAELIDKSKLKEGYFINKNNGTLAPNSDFYGTDYYIPVLPNTRYKYIGGTELSGTISQYDKDFNFVTYYASPAPDYSIVNEVSIFTRSNTRYVRLSCLKSFIGDLSFKAEDNRINYKTIPELATLYKRKQYGEAITGVYNQPSAVYKKTIIADRNFEIKFKIRFNQDMNIGDSIVDFLLLKNLATPERDNNNFKLQLIKKAANEGLFEDQGQTISFPYPKKSSGIQWKYMNNGTTGSFIPNLPENREFVGNDTFRIWYKGDVTLTANQDISMQITSSVLRIYHNSDNSTIASYTLANYTTLTALYQAIEADTSVGSALEDFEVEFYNLDGFLPTDLMEFTHIKLVSQFLNSNLALEWDAFPAYLSSKIDTSWHEIRLQIKGVNLDGTAINDQQLIIDGEYIDLNLFEYGDWAQDFELYVGGDDLGNSAGVEIKDLEVKTDVDYDDGASYRMKKLQGDNVPKIYGFMGHHLVHDHEVDGGASDPYSIVTTTGRLSRFFRLMDEKGIKNVSIQQVRDFINGDGDLPDRCWFLIYDDFATYIWNNKQLRDLHIEYKIKPGLALLLDETKTYSSNSAGYPQFDDMAIQYGSEITEMQKQGWCPHIHGYWTEKINLLTSDSLYTSINLAVSKANAIGAIADIWTYSGGGENVNTIKAFEHEGIRMGVKNTGRFSVKITNKYYINRKNISDSILFDTYDFDY